MHPFNAKPPRPQNNFPFHHPCIHLSARVSFLLDEFISLPLPRCLSDPNDPDLLTGSSCPSGLIGPQYPVRGDQYVIPLVTTPPPRSLATSSFAASLYFHFIISQSRSMQANRPTVNHTAIRAAHNLPVESSTAASKHNANDNEI